MFMFAIAAVLGIIGYRAYENGTLQADLQKIIGGMRKVSLGNNPAKQPLNAKLPPWAKSPGNPSFTFKNPDIGNFIGSQSSGNTIVASGVGTAPVISPSYTGGSGAGGAGTSSTATSTPTGGSGSKIATSRIS